jgi:F-type H+-transporting ATPase subunit b
MERFFMTVRDRLKEAAILAVVVFGSSTAWAAGSEEPPGWEEFLFQLLNLGIVVGAIIYFARKPVLEYFEGRRAQIKSDLETAASLLSEAEERNEEIQRRLSALQSEVEGLQSQSRARAEEESQRILAEAQRSADRIQEDAAAAIDQELLRAQRELRAEAAGLAVDMAADILSQQVGDADRARLLDEFISRVEDGDASSTSGSNG